MREGIAWLRFLSLSTSEVCDTAHLVLPLHHYCHSVSLSHNFNSIFFSHPYYSQLIHPLLLWLLTKTPAPLFSLIFNVHTLISLSYRLFTVQYFFSTVKKDRLYVLLAILVPLLASRSLISCSVL